MKMKTECLCGILNPTAAAQRSSSFASCWQLRVEASTGLWLLCSESSWLLLQSAPINWILIGPSWTSASSMSGIDHWGEPACGAEHRYQLQPETFTLISPETDDEVPSGGVASGPIAAATACLWAVRYFRSFQKQLWCHCDDHKPKEQNIKSAKKISGSVTKSDYINQQCSKDQLNAMFNQISVRVIQLNQINYISCLFFMMSCLHCLLVSL